MCIKDRGKDVPRGSWRTFVFVQYHVGPLAGHRSAPKTTMMLQKAVWWPTLVADVKLWCDRCWTCLKYRRRALKGPAKWIVTSTFCCWQEVMVDCEGPSTPADKNGCRYVLTYYCCVCTGVILEPFVELTHSCFRRSYMKAMMRSGTIPLIIRSDRGAEFKNLMMAELHALLGSSQKFGTEYRPCEQAN